MQNFHLLKVILACLQCTSIYLNFYILRSVISISTLIIKQIPLYKDILYINMYSMYKFWENVEHHTFSPLRKLASHTNFLIILARICNQIRLSSINLEITYISTNFEPKQQNISSSHKFSGNSPENFRILSSINLEIIHISTNFEPK